jgi:ABC-type uncharacterized transport system permease subunit
MNQSLFPLSAAIIYMISGFLTGNRLFGSTPARYSRKLPLALGFLGLILHGIALEQSIILDFGFNLGFFNAISLVSWTVVCILLLSSLNKPVENLGILLLPLAAITLVLQMRYPGLHLLGANASWGLKIHVLISLLAYSLLTLASVQAILLAVQDKQLHNRKPGGFVRALPPLQTIEQLLFEMIGIGFLLLTGALISGFVYLENMFAQHLVHKTILSITSWIVFLVLLWGRFKFGWRGRIAIRWTLAGFVVLMLAYFGSKAVLELLLQ